MDASTAKKTPKDLVLLMSKWALQIVLPHQLQLLIQFVNETIFFCQSFRIARIFALLAGAISFSCRNGAISPKYSITCLRTFHQNHHCVS